ncbi:MAG TPA: hypothetical protein PKN69_09230 [Candidatus Latescibacteria bacterium]|nr:hypothetical protein [Candidatus Latescibacterota bacterium]
MEFRCKDDWEKARARIEAWWDNEIIDRAVVAVTAYNGRPRTEVPAPTSMVERWTNADYLIARQKAHTETTYYGGESFPLMFVNLGPSVGSAYLGCELAFAETTAWQESPIITSWDTWLPFCFDSQNLWWRRTLTITRQAVEELEGISFVSITDLGNSTDILAHLRGPQQLLLDTLENRYDVEWALAQITSLWFQWYEELLAVTRSRQEGSCGWLGAWSPKRTYPLQCDFSCMISPQTFRWMVMPEMERFVGRLDHPIYHLDGPNAICHLDALSQLPHLKAIQWVPGDGNPSARYWPDLLKRILAMGKGVHVYVPAEDVEPLIDEVGPKGLFITTGVGTPEEAVSLLRRVEIATARAAHRGVA